MPFLKLYKALTTEKYPIIVKILEYKSWRVWPMKKPPKTIKTTCGIDKFHLLTKDKSVFGRVRLFWFVLFGTIRDLSKR